MKATLVSESGSVSVENPFELLLEVSETGETIGPFCIRQTGGALTVLGTSKKPALTIETTKEPGLIIQ